MAFTHFFTHNAGWKLVSLGVAVAIWAFVHTANDINPRPGDPTAQTGQRSLLLPITVMTSAEDPRGFLVRPPAVTVTVTGPSDSIKRLDATDVQAFVNLVDVKEARDLRKRILVRTPPGITLLDITQPEVTVQRGPAATPIP